MKKAIIGCMLVFLLISFGLSQRVEGQGYSIIVEEKISNSLRLEAAQKEEDELLEIAVQFQTTEAYENAVLSLQKEFQSYIGRSLTTNHQLHKQYLDELEKVTDYYWDNQYSIYFDNSRVEYVSKYTPFVFLLATPVEVDNLSTNPNIKSISQHSSSGEMQNIWDTDVCNAYNNKVCTAIPVEDYLSLSEIEEAKSYYNVSGDGVNIGILGADYCSIFDETELPDERIIYSDYCPNTSENDEHEEIVTLIASGETSGVANNATIFNAAYGISDYPNRSILSFEQALEVLTYSSDVINISHTSHVNDGIYDSDSQYIDSLVKSTYVSIVVSAGNFEPFPNPNRYVTSFSTATNVISVGSMDVNDNNVAYYSCYGTVSGAIRPDIIAAGGDGFYATGFETGDEDGDGYYNEELEYYYVLEVPSIDSNKIVVGTSFAAPIVVGTIALMIELSPNLAYHPYEIKSILMASSDTTNISGATFSNSTGLSTIAGSGKLNAMNALYIVENQTSFSSVTSTTTEDITIKVLYVYVQAGNSLRIAFSPLRNQQESTNVSVSYYNIYIDKWNGSEFVTVAYTYGTSTDSKRISRYIAASQTYRIRIVLTDNNDATHTQFGGLSVYNTLETNLVFNSYYYPGC